MSISKIRRGGAGNRLLRRILKNRIPDRDIAALRHSVLRIQGADGNLSPHLYQPADGSGAAALRPRVAIVHAERGRSQQQYAGFARCLVERGWTVVTCDYPVPDRPERMPTDRHQRAATEVTRWVHGHLQPRCLVAIAHGTAGEILGGARSEGLLDAIVLVCAQDPEWRPWSQDGRPALRALRRLMPAVAAHASSGEPMPNTKLQTAAEEPRGALQESGVTLFYGFRGPLLSISVTDDRLRAPRQSVDRLTQRFDGARVERWHLHPAELGGHSFGHCGFFMPARCSELRRRALYWVRRQDPVGARGTCAPQRPHDSAAGASSGWVNRRPVFDTVVSESAAQMPGYREPGLVVALPETVGVSRWRRNATGRLTQ